MGSTSAQEIQKACPKTKLTVCKLPVENKGDDFVDWIQAHSQCPSEWDGFSPIDEPYSEFLRVAFEDHVNKNSVDAAKHFEEKVDGPPVFDCPLEPIRESLSEVLPCPTLTLPKELADWIQGNAKQMQIAEDYFVASLLVYLGSLIGRKRSLRLRQGTSWIEFANLWGMVVGRPAMMKSPAMKVALGPLEVLANRAIDEYNLSLKQYEGEMESWKIRNKACEEVYKTITKAG